MHTLCTHCHYIGKPKVRREPTYFGIAFTAVVAIIFLLLSFWHAAFIIGFYLSISFSLLLLAECFAYSDLCPNCNEKSLIPVNSDYAKKIIHDKNIHMESISYSVLDKIRSYEWIKNEVRILCPKCHNTDAGVIVELCHATMGMIVLFLGLISIPLAYFTPLSLIGSSIYIISGISLTLGCFIESRLCMNCVADTMIPIDSRKAEMIIEQNELNITSDYGITHPSLLSYRYGIFILFLVLILAGYSMYKLYIYFSSL